VSDWPPPPQFEAPDDPRFEPPRRWERGHAIEPAQLTLADILDRGFNLYRMHWRSLVGFVAILIVPLDLVEQYLTRNFPHYTYGQLGQQPSPSQNTNLAIISLVFAAISFFFVQPLIQGGLARAVARFHLGEQPTVGDIAEGGLPLIGPVVWVIFLYTLVVLGGLIALIIPGIFFAIRFSFGVPGVVLDKLRGTEALRRSWRLTEGNFWRVLGIGLVAGLLTGVAAAVIAVPAALIADQMGVSGWFVRAIGLSIATVLTMPFSQMVNVLLYFDLRVRKEGLTLDRLHWEAGAA